MAGYSCTRIMHWSKIWQAFILQIWSLVGVVTQPGSWALGAHCPPTNGPTP